MGIDPKKVLTISAGDYCAMHKVELDEFEHEGVHLDERVMSNAGKAVESFARMVPESAEVVVGYQFSVSEADMGITKRYASGTALLRKIRH